MSWQVLEPQKQGKSINSVSCLKEIVREVCVSLVRSTWGCEFLVSGRCDVSVTFDVRRFERSLWSCEFLVSVAETQRIL